MAIRYMFRFIPLPRTPDWQFCWKKWQFLSIFFFFKCQIFGNFLTFKWQFFGGSDANPVTLTFDHDIRVTASSSKCARTSYIKLPGEGGGNHSKTAFKIIMYCGNYLICHMAAVPYPSFTNQLFFHGFPMHRDL